MTDVILMLIFAFQLTDSIYTPPVILVKRPGIVQNPNEGSKLVMSAVKKHLQRKSILYRGRPRPDGLGNRYVRISYDAPNGYGVVLLDEAACRFDLHNGEVGTAASLRAYEAGAEARREVRAMARAGSLASVKPENVSPGTGLRLLLLRSGRERSIGFSAFRLRPAWNTAETPSRNETRNEMLI